MQREDSRLDPIITAWREVSEAEPLPDVRRVWRGRPTITPSPLEEA